MWKIILGFIVIAGAGMYVLMKSGGNIDLGGEKGGIETHAPAAPASGASEAKH